ncbi:MAG: NADH-quinone oxidoreductase subunit L [Gammaproteobacteria bacterium]|nr:NADH-quinone oxidoreductase subunit L [Gammaproteobacteria bacterium]
MYDLIWVIPLAPLVSFVILFATQGNLGKTQVAYLGVGSVGLSALIVVAIAYSWLNSGSSEPYTYAVTSWINVAGFNPGISFYLDGLALTMMLVITGVGFLIHLYASLFMEEDGDYSRFFAYMNLFVSAMLILVLADNMLLLYVGWEGVGLCSYLLVGFWYEDPANGAAARKAFIVTRIGDTAMALGLFLLFMHLGTLHIQPMMQAAKQTWATGDTIPTIAALLLLGGAVGKSAQLPLQTWLPDAMAGPTPVSALIHAATMVTAGVYLIARTHELYLLAPLAQSTVAVVGLATLLIAAFTALTQTDIKRILAYSTISQIGYMFLALGVGAWASGIFHLMTHAFFKALLFLAAGAVIYSLHHEHDIFKMGGLRTKLPVAFWSFLIGSAALTALPLTSGFFSKDEILLAAFDVNPWLWAGGLLGAFLTSIYSFRLGFVVFFGQINTEPSAPAGARMAVPLIILCGLSIIGGWFHVPVDAVFPTIVDSHHDQTIAIITPLVPILGVLLAYLLFLRKSLDLSTLLESLVGVQLRKFFFSHWGMDWAYDKIFVVPYTRIARMNQADVVDMAYEGIANITSIFHYLTSFTQTGQLRWYAFTMVGGLIFILAIIVGII